MFSPSGIKAPDAGDKQTITRPSRPSSQPTDRPIMKKIILFQIAALLFAVVARAAIPDNFANAQVLSGSLVSATNSNQTATTENGEPTATGNQTLWYVWTAPATGEATIN